MLHDEKEFGVQVLPSPTPSPATTPSRLLSEKEFGVTILPSPTPSPSSTPSKPFLAIDPLASVDSTLPRPSLTTQTSYSPSITHPLSAFYTHPTTRLSLEQLKSSSTVNLKTSISVSDLEAARLSTEPYPLSKKESSVWPCKTTLQQRSRELKRSKGCSPLRKLSRKQRLWVKALIAVTVVALAVGVGVGVSRAVGAGVWKSEGQQAQIGGASSGS